jgi:UV DNA damage repair endonuclease
LAAILVGSRDHRTQFWKGAIQESFQQSLVEIGSAVLEEKIFFKFHPPFFLFLQMAKLLYFKPECAQI